MEDINDVVNTSSLYAKLTDYALQAERLLLLVPEVGKNPLAQFKVARCLFGLKMVSQEFFDAHKARAATAERKSDVRYLKDDAERLGFKIVSR